MIARVGLGDAAFSCAPGYYQPSPDYTACIPNDWMRVPGCWIGPKTDWPLVCPSLSCGGSLCPTAQSAPAPSYSAPAPSAPAPSTPAAVGPQPNYSTAPKVVTVEIQTPDGAVSVAMPEEYIPGTADHDLTPARVRIPNIWDSLDPTKTSQFAYRGLARSLPVWISKDWRETLSAAAAPAAPAVDPLAAAAEMPFLAFVAIGAACWMLRDKKGKR